jgi:HSP20 family protein
MATTTERKTENQTQESGQRNPQSAAGENQPAFEGSHRAGGTQNTDVAVGQGGAVQQRAQGGMSRYGRDPFEMMQRISDEMDQLFDSFFYGRPAARQARQQSGTGLRSLWAPEVELSEEGSQVRVCVDLPGVAKDNVKIDVHEGMLTIQGERREERTDGGEGQGFRRSERRYGSFYRTIPLPEGAQAENAQAKMKDGVLEITIPITPAKQPRRLEIQG